jgi:hypothetical protein
MRAVVPQRVGMLPSLTRWTCPALVLAILVNAGCAVTPVNEAMEYERADARLEAIEQFELLKQACRASGGVIYTDEGWGRLKPTLIDLRMVRCISRVSPMPRMRR